jgi:predicted nicotinamide N-methyase
MTAEQLIEEERLDALDPLRHLRGDSPLDDAADATLDNSHDPIVPPQRVSVVNQIIELELAGLQNLRISVDASPGCGGIVWPAGEVLSRYLIRRGRFNGKVILELGSGTGLVGLVAGLLGAQVYITDQSPLLDIMQKNVVINGLEDRVSVLELNWGDPLPAVLPARIDMILAADCVYFEPAFPLLVQTLCDLCECRDSETTNPPEILFCYKKRRKADKRFFSLLKKHFDYPHVSDDPDQGVYSRDSISLLKLVKKR